MSEWWTYTPSDFLMFSPQVYFRLFALYNAAVWPVQIAALALGVSVLGLWRRGGAWHGRAIAAILAAAWLWSGYAYLYAQYDTINWAGRWFAAGFALQAALILWTGLVRDRLALRPRSDPPAAAGLTLFVFAFAAYPLIAPLLGRPLAQAEIFGLVPDPTAVATLGVLLAAHRVHAGLLVLPLTWCAISGMTLWTMDAPEAPVLPAAAIVTIVLAAWKLRRR